MYRKTTTAFLAAATLAIALLGGCDPRPASEQQCEALLDHYVSLKAAEATSNVLAQDVTNTLGGAYLKWSGRKKRFVAQCSAELTRSEARCGLRANTVEAFEACD